MRHALSIGIAAGLTLTAGCGGEQPANQANAAAAAKPKEKVPHCFFKDADLKDWKLALDRDGNAVVTGRAYRADGRYKVVFGETKIDGRVAILRPTITINDTGFSADENIWDLSATVPAGNIDSVEVRCGKKTVAALPLPAKAG